MAVLAHAKHHALSLEKQALYKHDIAAWAKDKLGITLWSKQREIAAALIAHKKVAVKSCHGSGKSYFASIVVAWWVDTRYGTEAVVVSTAPTYEQVNKILWRYIRQHHGRQDDKGMPILLGHVTQTDEWKDANGETVAWGRKPADTNQNAFQGIHSSGGVLAVIDEACGVNETLFTGVEAITTGILDRILAIANPDIPQSEFGRIFLKNDPAWHKITISAFDTPNFTGEYMPEIAKQGLVSVEWVEDKKLSWGEDSARYKSKILGEFTTDAGNTLFTMETIMRAQTTELELVTEEPPRLGVDVARFGEDFSVAYMYHQGKLRFVKKWSKTDAVKSAEIIRDLAFELGAKEVRIDGVGLGGPIMDMVAHISDNRYEVIGMVGNAASIDLDKWVNARAVWYDTMREKMFTGQIDLDPTDEHARDLEDELGMLEYFFSKRGGLQIMDKTEIRKVTGKSPDFADAACYACADLGYDPTAEEAKLKPGEEFSMGLEDILAEWEMQISPL